MASTSARFTGCLLLCLWGFGTALADSSFRVDIPAGDLKAALDTLSKQSGAGLVYRPEQVKGLKTHGAHGVLTVAAAAQKLLEGTGLEVSTDSTGAMLIAQPKRPAAGVANLELSSVGEISSSKGAGKQSSQDFRVAQVDQGVAGPQAVDNQNREKKREQELTEIVVTGTHIRGAAPAGSNVISIDRAQIESSGYATIQDVLKTLPQNSGSGVGEVQSGLSVDTSAGNFNSGTAVNLRGLGADSTLVLVNGRRQPASGINGAFVDISSIAAAAVDRIEVLTDGASAIYGSDAIGGVVNVILRRDFDGAETRARVGSYVGDVRETQFSQIFGHVWDTGNALIGYQYQTRDNLLKSQRAYTASDNLTPFGGNDYRSSSSNPGNILDPNTGQPVFAIPRGQNGKSLTPSQLLPGIINYENTADQTDLLPSQRMQSLFFNANQRLGSNLELFVDATYGTRRSIQHVANVGVGQPTFVPASNPFFVDPFGGSPGIGVDYNFTKDLGPERGEGNVETFTSAMGLTADLPGDWKATLSSSYGGERTRSSLENLVGPGLNAALADPNPLTAFDPFGDGSFTNPVTLNSIRATQLDSDHSHIASFSLAADGSIARIAGGEIRLAAGVDHRREDISGFESFTGTPDQAKSLARRVDAQYAELAIPLVGKDNERTALQRLALSAAIRHEHYSDFGSTTNPKLGFDWVPVSSLNVRGTWGTSFKAPRLIQLLADGTNNFDYETPAISPAGIVNALVRYGNNPNLTQQTAHVWTAGLDWKADMSTAPRMSATYFQIDYRDRVEAPGPNSDPTSSLLQPDIWASVLTFNPSAAQIAAVCNSPTFVQDVATCLASHVDVIVDARLKNLARTQVKGLDGSIQESLPLPVGTLGVQLEGTYTLEFKRSVTPTSVAESVVNTLGNVPNLRVREQTSWNYSNFSASAFVNYTGSYRDNLSIPNRPVDSWTTVDLSATYNFASGFGVLNGTRVTLAAVNAFNHSPPFANIGTIGSALGYDPSNANLYGRIISLQLSRSWW